MCQSHKAVLLSLPKELLAVASATNWIQLRTVGATSCNRCSSRIQRLDLLGVSLDLVTPAEIEHQIFEHLAGSDPGLLHVATLNPEYVIAARNHPSFRDALDEAEFSIPDGIGIVLAVRLLAGFPIARITGVDLVSWLFGRELPESPRIFLLGTPESLAELQGRYPSRVVGRWGGGTAGSAGDLESIERIRERAANVVLVGYGAPAQVLWIERNRPALADAGVRLAIGVGGALDYLSGTVPRAPEPIRRLGLEWAYRLVREPWRWRRQLALPKFALLIAATRLHRNPPRPHHRRPRRS